MKKISLEIFFIVVMIYLVSITFFEKQNLILATIIVLIAKILLELVVIYYKKWKR